MTAMSRSSAARLLGVAVDATPVQVDDSFRAHVRAHHPDRYAPRSTEARAATTVMQALNDARRALSTPSPSPAPATSAHAQASASRPTGSTGSATRSAPEDAGTRITVASASLPRASAYDALAERPVVVGAALIGVGLLLAWLR